MTTEPLIKTHKPRDTSDEIRFALREERRAQKYPFLQNKANFRRFCAKNLLLQEKQTQSNPISTQFTDCPNEPKSI
jgi:hypothetical protein